MFYTDMVKWQPQSKMKLIKEENYMEITKKTNYRFACVILAVLLGLTAIAVPLSTAYTSNSTIAFAGTADGMYLSDNSYNII